MTLLLLLGSVPPHRSLLKVAESLVDQNPGAAVVFAHSASEIFTEQVLADAFQSRGVPELEEPITDLFLSTNLGNNKLRAVYEALTGDQIAQKAFWGRFKESSERRNHVVHRGKMPTADEARASCAAARELIEHLTTIAQSMARKRPKP